MNNKNQLIKDSYPTISIPTGKIDVGKYFPPTMERSGFITSRAIQSIQEDFKSFQPLNSPQLIHFSLNNSIDFYPEDTRKVVSLFLSYYGQGKLYVIQGFSSPHIEGYTAHSAGLALDIKADNAIHARKICNAAYRTGIQNIVLGGDFDSGQGYVHIDICPKEVFVYDAGYYEGPWT